MLQTLSIKNYVLIESLKIDFHKGLNIITGETGAGKSILLGALGLIQGNRADTGVLKYSDKKCIVEAEFYLEKVDIKGLFNEYDIDYDPITIVRREINDSGKSRAFINDTPVNLSVLQAIAPLLIDVHSQHKNLLMRRKDFWIEIIDKIGKLTDNLNAYKYAYDDFKTKDKQYNKVLTEYNNLIKERDFIEHQYNELKEANIENIILTEKEQELSQQEHAEEIKLGIGNSVELLNNETTGELVQLKQMLTQLGAVEKIVPDIGGIVERLNSIYIELKDIARELENRFDKIDFTPEHYEKLKNQVSLFYTLFQKYRLGNQQELLVFFNEIKGKYDNLHDGSLDINELKKERDKAFGNASQKADELTGNRLAQIDIIKKHVKDQLQELGMKGSELEVLHAKTELSGLGQDNYKFLFSANKNIATDEISKIASGGETSRLMLAIKSLLSNASGLPTIIFDEIDTGVSGNIADKVGNLIREMANNMQVINITHLPQVASKGDVHFKVYKNNELETARTDVIKLSNEERVTELAQMLSGETITDAAIANAKQLLGKDFFCVCNGGIGNGYKVNI